MAPTSDCQRQSAPSASKRSCSKRAERSRAILLFWRLSWKESQLRFVPSFGTFGLDDLNLFYEVQKAESSATVNCVDDFGFLEPCQLCWQCSALLELAQDLAADDL